MNFQTKFPQWISGYLSSKLTIPVKTGYIADEKDRPFVSVYCDTWESEHPKCWAGDVTIRLCSISERSVNDDAAIMAQIKAALRDHSAVDDYMQALPSSERKGWIMKKFAIKSGEIALEPTDETRNSDVILRVAVVHC